ncbi:hypothetical protein KFE25_005179 [Diacronema lutheri]|uniref:GAF domain-containing protein n=1 Tax=Diacronema lutheri TaxID=2081491 RepID=A0A8J6C0Z4_DIALT|nr:hypothetical protein KFE25_005179 [Diacronema lutheri]
MGTWFYTGESASPGESALARLERFDEADALTSDLERHLRLLHAGTPPDAEQLSDAPRAPRAHADDRADDRAGAAPRVRARDAALAPRTPRRGARSLHSRAGSPPHAYFADEAHADERDARALARVASLDALDDPRSEARTYEQVVRTLGELGEWTAIKPPDASDSRRALALLVHAGTRLLRLQRGALHLLAAPRARADRRGGGGVGALELTRVATTYDPIGAGISDAGVRAVARRVVADGRALALNTAGGLVLALPLLGADGARFGCVQLFSPPSRRVLSAEDIELARLLAHALALCARAARARAPPPAGGDGAARATRATAPAAVSRASSLAAVDVLRAQHALAIREERLRHASQLADFVWTAASGGHDGDGGDAGGGSSDGGGGGGGLGVGRSLATVAGTTDRAARVDKGEAEAEAEAAAARAEPNERHARELAALHDQLRDAREAAGAAAGEAAGAHRALHAQRSELERCKAELGARRVEVDMLRKQVASLMFAAAAKAGAAERAAAAEAAAIAAPPVAPPTALQAAPLATPAAVPSAPPPTAPLAPAAPPVVPVRPSRPPLGESTGLADPHLALMRVGLVHDGVALDDESDEIADEADEIADDGDAF